MMLINSKCHRIALGSPLNVSRQSRRCIDRPQVRINALLNKGFGKSDSAIQKNRCPCGSNSSYSECCQPLHKFQLKKVAEPEQLLKARFAAYVKKDWKYIVRTTHSLNPGRLGSLSEDGKVKSTFDQDVKVSMSWAEFSNLEVAAVRPGASNPNQVEIDFSYQMKQIYELATGQKVKDPPIKVIKDSSIFEMDDGEWKLLSSLSNWDSNKLQPKS